MEIVRSHRQLAAAAGGGGAGALPTYRAAPQLGVRLEEFEIFAIDRLRGASFCLFLAKTASCLASSNLANGWSAARFAALLLGSSQGDLGWAFAGEEARGDGEAGELFDSPSLLSCYCREVWE